MRRFLMIILVVMTSMSANAQFRKGQVLTCTVDNVNVRKGPGKNYGVLIDKLCEMKCQLYKGATVKYAGKMQNGFLYVIFDAGCTAGTSHEEYGWVPRQYLKSVLTKRCPKCKGKGYFNRPCQDYDGEPLYHPNLCSCHRPWAGYGKQICHSCNGQGLIK